MGHESFALHHFRQMHHGHVNAPRIYPRFGFDLMDTLRSAGDQIKEGKDPLQIVQGALDQQQKHQTELALAQTKNAIYDMVPMVLGVMVFGFGLYVVAKKIT